MTKDKKVLQAIRESLPASWGKKLSDETLRLVACELGFLKPGIKKEFRPTQRGVAFSANFPFSEGKVKPQIKKGE